MQPLAPEDPRTAGEFRLSARLGLGGMGQVFLGYSPAGRAVAVKVCHPELAADPTFVERFAREATAAQAVNGLYTAQVLGAGPYDKPPWLATAYVPGPPLSDYVEAYGPLPEAAAWRLAAGLAEALLAVHACGLVHRDLKPSNVLLAVDGPRVIDFGIASALEVTGLTTAGSVIGSPPYMSPEQAMGEPTGPPSDVFALGATLTFAVSGAPPFGDGDPPTVLFRVVHAAPALDRLPAALGGLVAACLAKDPAARPTLHQVLRACQDATAGFGGSGYGGSAASFWPAQMTAAITGYGTTPSPSSAERGRSGGSGGAHPRTVASTGGPAQSWPTSLSGRAGHTGGGLVGRRRLLVGLGGVAVAGGLAAAGWELTRPGQPKTVPTAAADSRLVWAHKTGGPVHTAATLSADRQTLYVGSDDGSVYALDTATGSLGGTFPVGGAVSGVSIGGSGNTTLLAGGANGQVHAFAVGNGGPGASWTYSAGRAVAGPPTSGLLIDKNIHIVYAGSADGYLHALEYSSGMRLWRAPTGGTAMPGVPEGIGQVWTASSNGSVYLFNSGDGTQVTKPFPTGGPVASAPVEFSSTVYVGSGGAKGRLNSLAVGITTNVISPSWQFPANGAVVGAPAEDGSTIYTATTAGTVYALSTYTLDERGNEITAVRVGGPVRSGLAAYNGLVYVGCDDGYLYAIDFSSGGSVSWRYQTGGPIRTPILAASGIIYFGSLDHKVYALRA